MPLTMNDDEAIVQSECHEGNLGVTNILSAVRATEKANQAQRQRSSPGGPRCAETRHTARNPGRNALWLV